MSVLNSRKLPKIERLERIPSYILLVDLLVILGTFGFMTAALVYLNPSNMNTELMQVTILGNTLGITLLAFVTLVKWRIE